MRHRTKAPNVLALVSFANLLANWVSVTVLQCRDISSRKRTVTKFINIMDVRIPGCGV